HAAELDMAMLDRAHARMIDAAASPFERVVHGRAARVGVPRRSHAAWDPPPRRADPLELLEQQATTRVAELVPIRYGRMLVSPFTFYRGGARIMEADFADRPR